MSYDIHSKLSNLLKVHGDSEFGNICQILLELTFIEMGYNTRGRNNERPDIVARKEGEGLSIECKCPAGSFLSLTQRDLDGVMGEVNALKIVATIVLDLKPFWIFADATNLKADKYSKIMLKTYDFSDISQKVNTIFPAILNRYYEIAWKRGAEGLRTKLKQK